MEETIAGFADQQFEPTPLYTLGYRIHELEQALPDQIETPVIEQFWTIYNLFDQLDQVLEKARLPDSRAELQGSLKTLAKDYKEYLEETFKQPVAQKHLANCFENTFDLEELHTLCYDLKIDREDVSDSTTPLVFARDLIGYCSRHKKMREMIELLQEQRPRVEWFVGQPGHRTRLSATWHDLRSKLDANVKGELKRQIVLTIPPPPPPRENLDYVAQNFESSSLFNSLPEVAQRLFQEAANCFACEQYTAATVLSWQAARATLIEYCQRGQVTEKTTTQQELTNLSWQEIVEQLPIGDRENLEDPFQTARRRAARKGREYSQAVLLHNRANKKVAWNQMVKAIGFSAELVEYWQSGRLVVSVEIGHPLDRDTLAGLYVLERLYGGLGRVVIPSETSLSMPGATSRRSMLIETGYGVQRFEDLSQTKAQISQMLLDEKRDETKVKQQEVIVRTILQDANSRSAGEVLDALLSNSTQPLQPEDRRAVEKLRQILAGHNLLEIDLIMKSEYVSETSPLLSIESVRGFQE